MPTSLLSSFIVLTLIGMPVGFVLGLTALFGFILIDKPVFLTMIPQRFFSSMDGFSFLALPFFLLAGDIMNRIGLTERLVAFANLFFGRMRGGLAQVNIVTSIIFGGISGAAMADTAALGSVFIPAMEKEGYDTDFSAAVTVASSIIAPIIPPSIIMVIYGAIMGVSIAGLFAAGIVPGLMIGLSLMILTRFYAKRRNYPRHVIPLTVSNISRTTGQALPALVLPFIILGGILGGVVTPTEAAAVAVGYALFLGCLIYRNLGLKDLYELLYRNAITVGIIAVIVSGASILAWLLAMQQIPQMVAELFLSITQNKYFILLLINLLLVFIGMFLDITASLLILGPILAPLATNLGVDPLHFGVMMCVNLNIALMTPPMGACLFMAMIVSKRSLGQIVKAIWPFILVELFVLLLVIYIPVITMTVPRWLGFAG